MSSGLHHELSSGLWSRDMNSSAQLDVWCVAEQELNSYLICCFLDLLLSYRTISYFEYYYCTTSAIYAR